MAAVEVPRGGRGGDAVELVVPAALWGGSFLFMRIAAPEFGPVPLMAFGSRPAPRAAGEGR